MGHVVTGSDLRESAVTERLSALGIPVSIGHEAANVGSAEVVTVSTAVARSNPEVVEAHRRGVPVLSRASRAGRDRRPCGGASPSPALTERRPPPPCSHSSLVEADMHPSFLIGGDVNEIGTNAVWDSGEWIVVEADESDGTFLSLTPDVAVVTSVEADHLDHYGSFDALREAFERFVASARLHRVVGGDDPEAVEIGRSYGADTVGVGRAGQLPDDRSLARAELGLVPAART